MHETGLIRGLLRAARAAARAQGGGRVTAVGARIGALAGVSGEHLREHWDQELRGTELEGATLSVEVSEDPGAEDALHVVLLWVDLTAS